MKFLVVTAVATAAVLAVTVDGRIHDSNFVSLTEATAILAGDRPYRDFFDAGSPLAAYVSAAVQWLFGYRLISEFMLQWLLITSGVVIAFHLGLRLSRSVAWSAVMLVILLPIIASTETYHYSKLFFFPLVLWLAWRYIDAPSLGRSVAMAVATALAFMFRHDYGVYLGFACAVTLGVAALKSAGSLGMRARRAAIDAAAYAIAAAAVVAPWAVAVQRNEGLAAYVGSSASKYQGVFGESYASLLQLNPFQAFGPAPLPPPTPAIVGFVWNDSVDARRQQELEHEFGLTLLGDRDGAGRLRYKVTNLYDTRLLGLDPYINDGAGFNWDRLRLIVWRVPSRANALLWLQQMAQLVPILLLVTAAIEIARARRRAGGPIPDEAWHMIVAGAMLALIDAALFREPEYVMTVAPLTAALSTRLVAGPRAKTALSVAARTCAFVLVALTAVATAVWTSGTPLFEPTELAHSVAPSWRKLLAAPPVQRASDDRLRYLHECTSNGDRLLVTGSVPFDVSYYVERPIAGGHLYWHHKWRSAPEQEALSLALLERQSVPFVISTHDPILDDFKPYPRIREYLVKNYRELEGSEGKLLVDRRRTPTGVYGSERWPCFAARAVG